MLHGHHHLLGLSFAARRFIFLTRQMAIVGGGASGAGVWHLMAGRARIYFACKRAQFAI